MRRRKLLISIGALGAGGTAAFGTEAFTSVEAERSVDVTVAGDESAFLAIQPLSGNNANQYVSTEDGDETVALDFDGDAGTDGSGVNQDAVTQVEDLFKIINQGTQPTSVFFEDDSDAVTFRVTQSTDTSTKGPSGESLEGADNSVELETGEQVAVGITVDTLNNGVSGSLVDDVTIRAEAGASAPEQNIPEPQFVVSSSSPNGPNQFRNVQPAINEIDSESESGAVIGIEGGFDDTGTDNQPNIDVPGVTLTGLNGSTPQIGTLDVSASDVTVKNVDVDGGVSVASNASDVTIDGVTFDGNGNGNPVGENLDNLTITNSNVQDGGVEFSLIDGASAEISNNSIDAGSGIGISVTSANNGNLTIENNEVTNVGSDESGIKVDGSNVNINRETGTIDAIESLLAENGINTATVNGTTRQRSILSERIVVETADDLNDRAGFTSIQDAINGNSPVNDAADEKIDTGGTILVENGTFDESVTIDVEGLTLEAAEGANPTVDASGIDGGSIPVLVDGASGVTVDDSINFKSGIDVGADFSGYEPGISDSEANAIVTSDPNGDDEYNSIGAALDAEGADTTVLVKSDYDSSNEDSDNAGSSSALISIVDENVEVISEAGPEATVIDERPDAPGDGRAVDIEADDVVFKGFDVADAAQEGIFVKGVTEASGIEITDNKIQSDNSGIIVSDFPADDADSASTDAILIKNNRINHARNGISLAFGAENPEIRGNTIIGAGDDYQNIALQDEGDGVTSAIIKANLITESNNNTSQTKRGLLVANDNSAAVDELSNNHFTGSGFPIQYQANTDIDASQNWFGTEDKASIVNFEDNQIDDNVGSINVDPFAGAPIDPDAGDDD